MMRMHCLQVYIWLEDEGTVPWYTKNARHGTRISGFAWRKCGRVPKLGLRLVLKGLVKATKKQGTCTVTRPTGSQQMKMEDPNPNHLYHRTNRRSLLELQTSDAVDGFAFFQTSGPRVSQTACPCCCLSREIIAPEPSQWCVSPSREVCQGVLAYPETVFAVVLRFLSRPKLTTTVSHNTPVIPPQCLPADRRTL